MKSHLGTHESDKPFMCDLCGTSYRQKITLQRHKLTHSKVNSFHCTTCGKYFRHKHYLVQHERVHTGSKPFPCTQCDKAFTQRSNLAKHEKQKHSGEREYICPFCKKARVYKVPYSPFPFQVFVKNIKM